VVAAAGVVVAGGAVAVPELDFEVDVDVATAVVDPVVVLIALLVEDDPVGGEELEDELPEAEPLVFAVVEVVVEVDAGAGAGEDVEEEDPAGGAGGEGGGAGTGPEVPPVSPPGGVSEKPVKASAADRKDANVSELWGN
jgi:hypothetical protein